MPQQIRIRPQSKAISYSANNKVSESLARGFHYRELALRLSGTLTVTAGNNTQANTQRGDEWGVVSRIEIVANGVDVIHSIDGNALWWLNYFLYGRSPLVTSAIGGGGAHPSFDSVLVLPFWSPNSVRPLDTALDSSELSSLEVRVTWGDHTSINSAATAFGTAPSLDITSLESFGVSGPFSQRRLFTIEKEITATNSRFQVQLPVGKMFRAFLINTTDAGVDQGDILNNLKLISGTTVFADVSCADDVLQQWTKMRGGLQADPTPRSNNSAMAGWYYLDLVTDGFMGESIDTLGFSEMIAEMDVTVGGGTTKVVMYPTEIQPVRGGGNG